MIRDAVIHLNNEQPLLADLYEPPAPGDVGLRCTNLRQMNGKRPVFIDDVASIFFFPYLHIRFVEIPPAALSGGDLPADLADDDAGRRPVREAVAVAASGGAPDAEAEADLEIDEDFLRRVREA